MPVLDTETSWRPQVLESRPGPGLRMHYCHETLGTYTPDCIGEYYDDSS